MIEKQRDMQKREEKAVEEKEKALKSDDELR